MFEIKGLDQPSQSVEDAQATLGNLDGDLASLSFDPADPASIEAAIQEMERVVDERVCGQADNPFVAPLVGVAKESFRQAILDKAAAARAQCGEG